MHIIIFSPLCINFGFLFLYITNYTKGYHGCKTLFKKNVNLKLKYYELLMYILIIELRNVKAHFFNNIFLIYIWSVFVFIEKVVKHQLKTVTFFLYSY